MRTYCQEVDINAPAGQVWQVMADIEHWPEWTASIRKVTPLDPLPLRVGSRIRIEQPKLRPANFAVTIWNPPHRFEWVTKSPGIQGIANHEIEQTGDTTRVRLSVTFAGRLSLIVAWFFGPLTRKYLAMEAAGLKQRSEE